MATFSAGMQATATAIDIEKLVNDATWKDILIDLVHKNELDPWNIDIIYVVDKYIEAVKGMKMMDLRVPANIILAASILLRLKSQMLKLDEEAEQLEDSRVERPFVTVDALTFRLRLPPKRRIALSELLEALEEAMKLKEVRESRSKEEEIIVPIKFTMVNLEDEMNSIYSTLEAHADKSNMITFSQTRRLFSSSDMLINLFVPLLFLYHNSRIELIQESFFGEIIIALNKAGPNAESRDR